MKTSRQVLGQQRKHEKPRHYWIQTVYLDEQVHNAKVFVTPQTCQLKAEHAARQEGVDVVLILAGGANPDCPNTDQIIQRVEPRPFTEFGKKSAAIKHPERLVHMKSPGAAQSQAELATNPMLVYTTLGKFNTVRSGK